MNIISNVSTTIAPKIFSEINRIRSALFHHKGTNRETLPLPASDGQPVTLSQKLFVPVKEHPDVSIEILNCTELQI